MIVLSWVLTVGPLPVPESIAWIMLGELAIECLVLFGASLGELIRVYRGRRN